jgi:exonuclease SbcC
MDERLARLDKLAADSVTARTRRDSLHAELDLLANLERAYGRDGIPALILETSAIPQLEIEASRYLTILGGAATQVELRTQRELKSGDGVKEALDIVLLTDTGERDYSTFSGGERTRIDLSLRLALAKLLADRRGAESRVLVIDEPDGLDAQGFAALVEILNGLQDTFSKILVVSHHPDLRHAFDQSIEVVKDGGRSRVETGVEPDGRQTTLKVGT